MQLIVSEGVIELKPESKIAVRFGHGLGDCVYYAHVLEMYRRRGYHLTASCEPDKQILFRPVCHEVIDINDNLPDVPWWEAGWSVPEAADKPWTYNKIGINLLDPLLPHIGSAESLWKEVCDLRITVKDQISHECWDEVDRYVRTLPRPIMLLHTIGNTSQDSKSLPERLTLDIYNALLDRMDGSLILLDWDNRVPRLSNWRVRHLTDDWKWLDTEDLLALLHRADLLIGIDSGPLHASRLTDIPTVGVFPNLGHYPSRYCLPRARQINIVPREMTHPWNRNVRIAFNIIEGGGETIDATAVAEACIKMLGEPRYLSKDEIGADVQLQQFVLDWERGYENGLSAYTDRHRGFDQILLMLRHLPHPPRIVETGCIRAAEDWKGAGFSTYLFGAYVERAGGQVISVDNSPENCQFAMGATKELSRVSLVCQDSVVFLYNYNQPVDLFYFDSLDADHPESADHMLAEVKAAQSQCQPHSIIALDDTVYSRGCFMGSGAKAVPWLLKNGWTIIHSGYQTVLTRNNSSSNVG
jgi:hypothetical protein